MAYFIEKRGVSMAESIDELQIEINAKAAKANDAIDRLVGKLDILTTSLSKLGGSELNNLANGVQRLGTAMQTMNNIKTADFTRLATNLTKLGSVNTSALNSSANSISHLITAFNGIETVSANAQAIGDIAANIVKLGDKNIQKAIANMPQLATAMNNLMATLSRSPQVSQNVIQMTNALANLASQGSKVSSASNTITAGLNKTTTATYKASNGFKGLASYIGKFYAKYFLVVRNIKKMWSSIEGTADYIEAYNYFNVAMGKIGSDWSYQWEQYSERLGVTSAEEYAKSFEKRLSESIGRLSGLNIVIGADGKGLLTESGVQNLGLNIKEITQYASQLASITNSVGQTGETSLAISSILTKLAGDISSLFNVDYSSVAKNLQSGLIGQSRALYKYGIDITNATLQTKAYELGLSKAVSEMTQAEKMQLRTLAILEQSKVSWGDLANTINSPANLLRQFKNNLSETGMVFGQLFIPLMQSAMPVINGLTIALKRLLVEVAGFFGVKIDLDKFGQGYTEIEDDIDGITGAYDDAIEAANKFKSTTLGIDELNINSPQEDTSGSGTGIGGGIDLTDEILDASSEYEKVWNEAFKQMENASNKWADAFEVSLSKIGKIAEDFAIGDFFKAGEDTSQLVIDLNNFISKAISDVDWDEIGRSVGRFLSGINWIEVFKSIQGVISSAIRGAVDFWFGSLKEAPLETLLLTAVAMLNVGTIQNALSAKFGTKISPLKILGNIALAIETITISTDIGQKIAEQITGVKIDLSFDEMLKNWFNLDSEDWGNAWDEFLSDYFGVPTETENELAYSASTALKGAIGQINDEFGKYETDAKNYFRLSGNYDNLTDKQKEYVKQYADLFAERFPEIVVYIDDVTGAWKGTYEQLDDVIKKTKEYYKENAKDNALQSLYNDLALETANLESLQKELDDISIIEAGFNTTKIWKLNSEIEKSKDKIAKYEYQIEGISKAWDEHISEINTSELRESLDEINSNMDKTKTTWKDLTRTPTLIKMKLNYNEIKSGTQEAGNMLNNFEKDHSNIEFNIGLGKIGITDGLNDASKLIDDKVSVWNALKIEPKMSTDSVTKALNILGTDINSKIDILNKKGIILSANGDEAIENTSNIVTHINKLLGGILTAKINADTNPATNSVTNAVDAINKKLGSINTPNVDVDTSSAMDKIHSLRDALDSLSGPSTVVMAGAAALGYQTFDVGGFPEDGWFRASHGEIMGKFDNGQSVVANNMQIVDGIKGGVKEAVSEILAPYLLQIATNTRETAGNTRETANKDFSVNIGDREIARANARGQKAMGYRLIT